MVLPCPSSMRERKKLHYSSCTVASPCQEQSAAGFTLPLFNARAEEATLLQLYRGITLPCAKCSLATCNLELGHANQNYCSS
ncbi:hypothetical protein GOP47_0024906 [Adiantum capillus-veneris]|uniref:Uncharacterized protein n=1 Tax=Adiantum capillus-veneris TaxID=13818 RepID=A0A9D4U2N3_ADICA|nr:hypothetical protein GOP47_0024906 [Adiantum capillus-veneris]